MGSSLDPSGLTIASQQPLNPISRQWLPVLIEEDGFMFTRLWTLEERLEGRRVTLKHATASAWTDARVAALRMSTKAWKTIDSVIH